MLREDARFSPEKPRGRISPLVYENPEETARYAIPQFSREDDDARSNLSPPRAFVSRSFLCRERRHKITFLH